MILYAFLMATGFTAADGVILKRSDDVIPNPLEPVVQQLSQTVQSLQADLAAVKNSVTSISGKLQEAAAFTVFLSSNSAPISVNGILHFDNVEINIGNGYNKNTGIFTAPFSGLYVFVVTVTAADNDSIQVAIDKNGATIAIAHSDNLNGDTWDKGMAHVTVHLQTGDTVWARQNYGGIQVFKSWWTSFSGFLVHAD